MYTNWKNFCLIIIVSSLFSSCETNNNTSLKSDVAFVKCSKNQLFFGFNTFEGCSDQEKSFLVPPNVDYTEKGSGIEILVDNLNHKTGVMNFRISRHEGGPDTLSAKASIDISFRSEGAALPKDRKVENFSQRNLEIHTISSDISLELYDEIYSYAFSNAMLSEKFYDNGSEPECGAYFPQYGYQEKKKPTGFFWVRAYEYDAEKVVNEIEFVRHRCHKSFDDSHHHLTKILLPILKEKQDLWRIILTPLEETALDQYNDLLEEQKDNQTNSKENQ